MKPNTLPTGRDLLEELVEGVTQVDQVGRALRLATLVAELLTGSPITGREVVRDGVLLGGAVRWVLLDHYPVRDLRLDDQEPGRGFWVEETVGVVGTQVGLAPRTFQVTYQIGYPPGEVPEVLCRLVRGLAEWRLGVPHSARELLQIAEAAQALVEVNRTARGTYEAIDPTSGMTPTAIASIMQ